VNERALRRSLLAALAVLLCFAAASPLAEDAEALVRRALERFHRAEGLREGWREVYDEGIAAAERAIELDPRHAEAH
jgi:hypothetical protein